MKKELEKYLAHQKARLKQLQELENLSSHEMILENEIKLSILNLEFILKFD